MADLDLVVITKDLVQEDVTEGRFRKQLLDQVTTVLERCKLQGDFIFRGRKVGGEGGIDIHTIPVMELYNLLYSAHAMIPRTDHTSRSIMNAAIMQFARRHEIYSDDHHWKGMLPCSSK